MKREVNGAHLLPSIIPVVKQAWLALHESSATKRAGLSQGGRTPDSVCHCGAWSRAIVAHNRECHCLPGVPAQYHATQPMGWTTADTVFCRVAAIRGRVITPFHCVRPAVIDAMFRWLIEPRYVAANPFADIKVRGSSRSTPMEEGRVFSEGEWAIIRAVANGLEWSCGRTLTAAQRRCFVLDFAYASGLRSSEFVGATLGQIEADAQGDHWLN